MSGERETSIWRQPRPDVLISLPSPWGKDVRNISLCTRKGLWNGSEPVESHERAREFRVTCLCSSVLLDAQVRCYAVPPGRSRLKRFAYNQVVIA
jgi:hypothetical protein